MKNICEILGVKDVETAKNVITSALFKDKAPKDGELDHIINMCESFQLNPALGMLYLKRDMMDNIYPTLTVDGWYKLVNDHPDSDGYEFVENPALVELPLGVGQNQPSYCFESIGCKIYRKGRKHAPVVHEYVNECFNPFNDAWYSHPKRMLRHKAFSQAARIVFNFSGIYDPDEASRIINQRNAAQQISDLEVIETDTEDAKQEFKPVETNSNAKTEADADAKAKAKAKADAAAKAKADADAKAKADADAKAKADADAKAKADADAKAKADADAKAATPPEQTCKLVNQYLGKALQTNQIKECVMHLKGRIDKEFHTYIDSCAKKICEVA